MSQLTNSFENDLADMVRGQGLTLPTNWYMALGSAASDSSFTELSGTGYARVTVPRALANFAGTQGAGTTLASTGTSHATSNNIAISWGNPGGAWGTAAYVGFFNLASGGACKMWLALPGGPIVITTGDPNPVQIDIGALQMTLGLLGGCSDYLGNAMIDLIFRAQAYSWPATTYEAEFTVAPTSAGGGTEFSGGSYARQPIASSLAAWSGTQAAGSTTASTGTGGLISNNLTLTYPAPTATLGDDNGHALMDAATSGNFLFVGSHSSPRTVVSGGPALSYPPASIGITFA